MPVKAKASFLFSLYLIYGGGFSLFCQDNESFFKQIISDELKMILPLLEADPLDFYYEEKATVRLNDSTYITPSLKKKLLLYSNSYFMYDNAALAEDYRKFEKETPELKLSDNFFKYKLKFSDRYNDKLIFVDGKWAPQSALFGIDIFSTLQLLFKSFPTKDGESNKERAMEIIRKLEKEDDVLIWKDLK